MTVRKSFSMPSKLSKTLQVRSIKLGISQSALVEEALMWYFTVMSLHHADMMRTLKSREAGKTTEDIIKRLMEERYQDITAQDTKRDVLKRIEDAVGRIENILSTTRKKG